MDTIVGNLVFWALVAVWMALAALGLLLVYRPGGNRKSRLAGARVMSLGVIVTSLVFFAPFFVGWDAIPDSYITAANGSIALFFGIGLFSVARSQARAAAGAGQGRADPLAGASPMAVEVEDEYEEPRAGAGPPAPAAGTKGPPAGTSQTISCPGCGKDFDLVIRSLPVNIKCPHCGVEGELGA